MEPILIVAGSPRSGGNTDTMAEWTEDFLSEKGLLYERINLRDYDFGPCIECNACYRDGKCHVVDGMQLIYPKLMSAQKIVFTAPVFFYTFGALTKAFIDRTQCFWAAKFVLKRHPVEDPEFRRSRQLLPLACGGTNFPDTFDCYKKVLMNFCMMIEVKCLDGVYLPGIDDRGDILKDIGNRETVNKVVEEFMKA